MKTPISDEMMTHNHEGARTAAFVSADHTFDAKPDEVFFRGRWRIRFDRASWAKAGRENLFVGFFENVQSVTLAAVDAGESEESDPGTIGVAFVPEKNAREVVAYAIDYAASTGEFPSCKALLAEFIHAHGLAEECCAWLAAMRDEAMAKAGK